MVASVVQDGESSYILDYCRGMTRGSFTNTNNCADHESTEGTALGLSIVGYATGGALAATALVLWLTAPSASHQSTSALVGCGTGPGTAGVSCAFRF